MLDAVTGLVTNIQVPLLHVVPQKLHGANVSSSQPSLNRGDRVLHDEWGMGRVLDRGSNSPTFVTVEWQDGVREASIDSLRRLLPRTELAKLVERSSQLSAWTVRKADEQGATLPDFKGRFAGHAVHYYDAARLPALIEQLSKQDPWPIGALVIHSHYGSGKVVAPDARPPHTELPRPASTRRVHFFFASCPLVVPVQELRRLISGCTVASQIGVHRKTFSRLGARRGIHSDYSSEVPARKFFDEGRVEEICRRWCAPQQSRSFEPGRSIVLDSAGDLARIEECNENGQACLRYLNDPVTLQTAQTSELRPLVSLRELARSENMSRYKLQRLLAAISIDPVYQPGRTMYFDVNRARTLLQGRLNRESLAVSLPVLARRAGVSRAVLARKIRSGCIRTIGQKAAHSIDEQEAQRIERLLFALRNSPAGLSSLGICRLHQRGSAGAEVVGWELAELIKAVQGFTAEQRSLLFDQVVWLCEGAGQKRFADALDVYFTGQQKSSRNASQQRREALSLLPLFSHLPKVFDSYRVRLLFRAWKDEDILGNIEPYLRILACQVGASKQQRYQRFRIRVERSLTVLLTTPECTKFFGEVIQAVQSFSPAEDDFVPGAVVADFSANNPRVGVITRVEQQAWNAIAARWDKAVVVRFAEGERRMNPHTCKEKNLSVPPLAVLLQAYEATSLFRAVQPT